MLGQRILTAALVVPLAVAGMLWLPTSIIALVFAALMIAGGWEWSGLLRLSSTARIAYTAATVAVIAAVGTLVYSGPNKLIDLVLLAACVSWLAAVVWIMRFPRGWAAVMGRTDSGVAVGWLILAAPVAAVTLIHAGAQGPLLLLTFFFLIWAADTGAYAAGRLFGRHKLASAVSPGKTLEGAIGGVLAAMIIAIPGVWLLGYGMPRGLAFVGLAGWIALISIVGDLTISMYKRHAGLKDTGTLFPGHGGVLDRLDSVLAAAPWFVIGLQVMPSGL